MALYKADVWLGSNSGRQTVSVSANTIAGAKEQIRTIYQVSDTAIWNLHEAPRERAGGGVSDDRAHGPRRLQSRIEIPRGDLAQAMAQGPPHLRGWGVFCPVLLIWPGAPQRMQSSDAAEAAIPIPLSF